MRLISCHNGRLFTVEAGASLPDRPFDAAHQPEALTEAIAPGDWAGVLSGRPKRAGGFFTRLPALDALLPPGGLARGAVHELLHDPSDPAPQSVAALLAVSAADSTAADSTAAGLAPAASGPPCDAPGAIVWSDPSGTLYPPALADAGIDLRRLWILRPHDPRDELWAIAEAMRCRGVSVTVAAPSARLGRVDARRLQLATEHGGGAGVLIRALGRPDDDIYAAATRWRVAPARGERAVHRARLTLLHGHGGRVGQSVLLERCRESHLLRAVDELADRPVLPAAATG